MKEILLNRMYVGSYLNNNIGHEVINLFKDDNGSNYIYVNPYGQLAKKHNDIESILLVRGVNANTVEIIAKAVGVIPVLNNALPRNSAKKEQQKYILKNKITYGGVFLHKIYYCNDGEDGENVVYISFKAQNVYYPKHQIFLTTENKLTKNYIVLHDEIFPRQSLHWTYSSKSKAYKILNKIVGDKKIWEQKNKTQEISDIAKSSASRDFNFLNIVRKEYDEICYSNMLYYFLTNHKQLFKKFMQNVLDLKTKGVYTIQREKEHIDLLIQDEKNFIVIENKIKSGINGVRHDIYSDLVQSQLLDYHRYADENAKKRKKSFFIFAPNYNRINLKNYEKSEDYKVSKYSVLYKFFCKNRLDDKYYVDFLSALKIHTREIDNSNFEIMQERFAKTINTVKARK